MTDDLPALDIIPSEPPLFEALGELLVFWNRAEHALQRLLYGLYEPKSFDESVRVQTLIVELGNMRLTNALTTIANTLLSGDDKEHVLHTVAYFELLRPYRNYYIHGIRSIIPAKSGPHGFATQTMAKGKFTWTRDPISVESIRTV
jgi:hypothetical protein